jgi:plastocyanin
MSQRTDVMRRVRAAESFHRRDGIARPRIDRSKARSAMPEQEVRTTSHWRNRFRAVLRGAVKRRLSAAVAGQTMQQRLLLTTAIALCASLFNGCNDATHPTAPAFLSQALAGGEERLVTMMDGCDPESFHAADVSCTRSGGVTFRRFLELLGRHQTVGAWHFSPGTLNATVGQTLLALNQGGEVHTFTEVEHFAGGVIDTLNKLSGNPAPAPECQNLAPSDFIAPGARHADVVEEPGTEHYQCCIHPWMRLDVHVRP